MKQPPIKTKELSGSTVQIADGQNWEIASITAYGENAQGGTTDAPVALTGVDSAILFEQHTPINLAKPITADRYGVSVITNADGSVTVKGTATDETWPRLVEVNIPSAIIAGDITISLSSPASVKMQFQAMTPDGRKESYGLSAGSTSITVKIKSGYTGMHIFLSLLPDQTIDETFHIMIAQGTEPVPFVPYVEPSITHLPIPRPLHKVGDVRDICRTRVKSVYDKRIVLDGTEDWRKCTDISITGGSCFYPNNFVNDAISNAPVVASAYFVGRVSPTINLWDMRQVGTNVGIQFNAPFAEVSDFTAWLAEHPLTVYYQSTAYNGTNGLDVCLTEYQTGFVELDGTKNVMFYDYGNFKRLYIDLNSSALSRYSLKFSHGEVNTVPTIAGGLAASFNEQALHRWQILGAHDTWTALGVTDTATAKTWLAAQKAAGTPIQVAYQLATPETYATDPVDFDNAAGPLIIMTGGEVEVTLTHRMLTPYTAWTIQYDSEGEYTGDFFNVEDYDRIKQNIEYLREYAYFLYGGFTLRGMVAVTVESYGYASTIDALDANLEAIAANTFRPPDMLPVKQWRGNQPPPGADDWNRIENTCLLLFEQFERQFACLPKLAFELKGSAF